MTLLLVETQRAHQEFDRLWTEAHAEHGGPAAPTDADLGLDRNHFPFLLYEYFPSVPLRAVRSVAAAARALSFYACFESRRRRGAAAAATTASASAWLREFALNQWRAVVPESSPLAPRLAAAVAEFDAALEAEWAYVAQPAAPYPATRFAEIVRGKSALARATAAVLAELARGQDLLEPLGDSQHHLYAGLQLSREVGNWKQDFVAGAWSYTLVSLLVDAARAVPGSSEDERRAQVPEMGRHFYYSGLAEDLLARASEQFCRAMAVATELPPGGWSAMLAVMFERNEQLRNDIARLRRERVAQARGAQPAGAAVGTAPTTAATAPGRLSEDDVRAALARAVRYVAGEQDRSGAWGDFLLLAEQSTFWVTGYVGWTLDRLRSVDADLPRAAHWLLHNESPGGAWGYNGHWPRDADSIAHVILFLAGRPDAEPRTWSSALAALLDHQGRDGGFATIMDAEAWLSRFRSRTDDLRGWTGSHACVTAVIAQLLATLEGGHYRERALHAVRCLRDGQHAEGYWEAYWWAGRLYATARALQALRAVGEGSATDAALKARDWLLRSQLPDGGWAAAAEEPHGQAFHTAFAIQALCATERNAACEASLERGVQWVLARQLPDGSWPTVPILRVPHPRTTRPWEQAQWRVSILGLDVVVPDWRRVFTAATAIQALDDFLRLRRAGHAAGPA